MEGKRLSAAAPGKNISTFLFIISVAHRKTSA
jgi:hypothetical protein